MTFLYDELPRDSGFGHAIPKREPKPPDLSPRHIASMRKFYGLDMPTITDYDKAMPQKLLPKPSREKVEFDHIIEREHYRYQREVVEPAKNDFLAEWRKKYSKNKKVNQRLKDLGLKRWWKQ